MTIAENPFRQYSSKGDSRKASAAIGRRRMRDVKQAVKHGRAHAARSVRRTSSRGRRSPRDGVSRALPMLAAAHFFRALSACVSSGTAWKRSATRP